MSSLEELQGLLDGRGVEYEVIEPEDGDGGGLRWACEAADAYVEATFNSDDSEFLCLEFDRLITPARAVDVILGQTCELKFVNDYRVKEHVLSWGVICTNCGKFHELTHGKDWKHCPECGAIIVKRDEVEHEKAK